MGVCVGGREGCGVLSCGVGGVIFKEIVSRPFNYDEQY